MSKKKKRGGERGENADRGRAVVCRSRGRKRTGRQNTKTTKREKGVFRKLSLSPRMSPESQKGLRNCLVEGMAGRALAKGKVCGSEWSLKSS